MRPTGQRGYRRIATEEGFLSPGVLAQNARTRLPGVPLISAEGLGAGVARIVVGHMGEALPFWLPRIDNRYEDVATRVFRL